MRRAARAVQCGDAGIVACIAGDTNQVDSFRRTLENFSRFSQDAVYPYGAGGANASFAMIAAAYMRHVGATREDMARIAVSQRDNALRNPHALMKSPLTVAQYMAARPIAEPIHLYDCVMPCAGAEAFLVMRADVAAGFGLAGARILGTVERHNAFAQDVTQVRGGWAMDIDELYGMAGRGPAEMDVVLTYDDYPVITMMQLEDLGFCRKGEGPAFVRSHDLTIGGDFPHKHLGRPALHGPGRRGRRLPGPDGGAAPGARHRRADAGAGRGHRAGVRVRHDQLRSAACPRARPSWRGAG